MGKAAKDFKEKKASTRIQFNIFIVTSLVQANLINKELIYIDTEQK
jgi:hypothetical protein